jgi:hypothetical protein
MNKSTSVSLPGIASDLNSTRPFPAIGGHGCPFPARPILDLRTFVPPPRKSSPSRSGAWQSLRWPGLDPATVRPGDRIGLLTVTRVDSYSSCCSWLNHSERYAIPYHMWHLIGSCTGDYSRYYVDGRCDCGQALQNLSVKSTQWWACRDCYRKSRYGCPRGCTVRHQPRFDGLYDHGLTGGGR